MVFASASAVFMVYSLARRAFRGFVKDAGPSGAERCVRS
jgi:hypothetical protein